MGLCHVHKQMILERFRSRSLFVWLALSSGGCVFIRSVDLQQSPERPGHAGGYRIILYLPKCSRILHQLQVYTQGSSKHTATVAGRTLAIVSKALTHA
jgi:hypothetical protein